MRCCKQLLLILFTVVTVALPGPSDAQQLDQPHDVQLILAIDCSYSVDAEEFTLQARGLADAFRSPEVLAAIQAQPSGRIAVLVTQWAGPESQILSIPWRLIDSEASASAFADELETMLRRASLGSTAIGDSIAFALSQFPPPEAHGARQVIDISGDGYSNSGTAVSLARAAAIASGVQINALAIENEIPALAGYFEERVIAGPGSFVEVAADYLDFADAIRRKILRELRPPGLALAPQTVGG